MSLISGHETDSFCAVYLRQVLHQHTDSRIIVRVDPVAGEVPVADGNHRAMHPFLQHAHQVIPETVKLIGIRHGQNTVQLLHRREGQHSLFLRVVIIVALMISDGGKNDHVIIQAFCFRLYFPENDLIEIIVRSVVENTDGPSFPMNHG